MKIGLGPETGKCSKGRLQFQSSFLSNATQPETLKRYSQILYQNVHVKKNEPVSGTVRVHCLVDGNKEFFQFQVSVKHGNNCCLPEGYVVVEYVTIKYNCKNHEQTCIGRVVASVR